METQSNRLADLTAEGWGIQKMSGPTGQTFKMKLANWREEIQPIETLENICSVQPMFSAPASIFSLRVQYAPKYWHQRMWLRLRRLFKKKRQ